MLRVSLVGAGLGGLVAVPLFAAVTSGMGAGELLRAGVGGLAAAVDAVGWVLIPQIALAIAILSLALQQLDDRRVDLALRRAAQVTPQRLGLPAAVFEPAFAARVVGRRDAVRDE